MVRWVTTLFVCLTSTAFADIYQWTDGDGDGTLWLSDATPEPYADLSFQVLWWADLPEARLQNSNMVETNLSYANLIDANLKSVDLSYATLFGANLELSSIGFSTLHGADLRNTNVNNANLFYADITDADMTGMQNWESAMWIAARYNDNTIFPEGMDPNDYPMFYIEIPAPATLVCFVVLSIMKRKSRT